MAEFSVWDGEGNTLLLDSDQINKTPFDHTASRTQQSPLQTTLLWQPPSSFRSPLLYLLSG